MNCICLINEKNKFKFQKSESFVLVKKLGIINLGKDQDSVYKIFRKKMV